MTKRPPLQMGAQGPVQMESLGSWGRRNWMQAWAPWRRQGRLSRTLARKWGKGALAQGHKDPMTVSLSGYFSVSPHQTPSYLPDVSNVICTFPEEVVVENTEKSLQAGGEKPHIHQFSWGSTTNAAILASLSPIKAFIGTEVSRRAVRAGQLLREPVYSMRFPMTGSSPFLEQGRGPWCVPRSMIETQAMGIWVIS